MVKTRMGEIGSPDRAGGVSHSARLGSAGGEDMRDTGPSLEMSIPLG